MKAKAAIVITLVAIALSVFVQLHFIKDEGGGGQVLWRNDEAYLFMYDRPIGYRMSVLAYVLEPIKAYFHASAMSSDDRWNLSIIRITPAGAERHDQESAVDIRDFTPIGNEVYAHCPGGVCKWTGTRFELLSDQEGHEMGGEGRLAKGEFTALNGWSERGIRGASVGDDPRHYEFSGNLDDQIKVGVHGGNPVSVEFLRPGHAPERVWYHEQRTRRVSAAEYERVFSPQLN